MRLIIKKGQAAIEFIFSHMWAVIIVLAVIAILAYSGVLNPTLLIPDKCVIQPGILCSDFNVGTSMINLIIQNNFGKDVIIEGIEVTKSDGSSSCATLDSVTIENDQKALFTILNCNNGDVGEKFKGDIRITYSKDGTLTKLIQGSIVTVISGISTTTSSIICQNAQDDGLCNGLDIIFGIGYKAACCSEHGLCCG